MKWKWTSAEASTIPRAYYAYDIFWLSNRISFRFCFRATLITSATFEKFVLVACFRLHFGHRYSLSLLATCGRIRSLEQFSSGWLQMCHFQEFFIKFLAPFLAKKTQYTSQKNAASQAYYFHCIHHFFVLLFSIVERQLCLLHQVRGIKGLSTKIWKGPSQLLRCSVLNIKCIKIERNKK